MTKPEPDTQPAEPTGPAGPDDPTPPPAQALAPEPGERRLAHPPSDRYRVAEPEPPAEDPRASQMRGLVFGLVAAVVGAATITILGGVLTITSGLVVVAGATGWGIAAVVGLGAGAQLDRRQRVRLAVGLALASVAAGQLGLWAYARWEGGVLGPIDYLAEVFGLLVPLELAVAWIVAWATAR